MKSNAAYLSEHPLPVEPMSKLTTAQMQYSNSKDGTNVPTSTNADATTSSQTIAKPNVIGSFLVLYESNPERISGSIERFDGEIMSTENFNANKDEDFKRLKEWSLKNGKKIFILDVSEPLVKIIPEVRVVNNCR